MDSGDSSASSIVVSSSLDVGARSEPSSLGWSSETTLVDEPLATPHTQALDLWAVGRFVEDDDLYLPGRRTPGNVAYVSTITETEDVLAALPPNSQRYEGDDLDPDHNVEPDQAFDHPGVAEPQAATSQGGADSAECNHNSRILLDRPLEIDLLLFLVGLFLGSLHRHFPYC